MCLLQSSEFVQIVGAVCQHVILPRSPSIPPGWMFSLEVSVSYLFHCPFRSFGKGFSGSLLSLHLFSPEGELMFESSLSEGSNLIEPVPTHVSCDPINTTPPDLQGLSKYPRAHSRSDAGHIHSVPPVKILVGLGTGILSLVDL